MAGNWVVVWTSYGSVGTDVSDFSIQGQRYAANGSTLGSQFQVNTYNPSTQNKPAVADDGSGNFVVVRESNGSAGSDQSAYSVHGQRYASNGTPLGGQFQANTFTLNNQSSPAVSADASGNFVVGWNSFGSSASDNCSTSIQIQRYAQDGSTLGGEVQVNTFTTLVQSFPSIACDGPGNFVVAWESAGGALLSAARARIRRRR